MDPGVIALSIFFGLIALMLSGALGGWVAVQKGRRYGEGFLLGAGLGPLGWLVEGLLPNGWDVPARD